VNPSLDAGDKSHSPFCSERCKLIDLGRWLDGKYQIPVAEPDESTGEKSAGSSQIDLDD
jgi:hypothetical protein